MENFDFAVIETPGIPGYVSAAWSLMKILVERAVHTAQSFQFIPDTVGVHQVHDHGQSGPMGGIDQ